jgi:hypothetical protein
VRAGTTIHAELSGADTCSASGITVKSESPVLAVCRKLIDAGHDPATPLEAYRGETLALHIRSIGQAAALRVDTSRTGRPVFRRARSMVAASPMRQTGEA